MNHVRIAILVLMAAYAACVIVSGFGYKPDWLVHTGITLLVNIAMCAITIILHTTRQDELELARIIARRSRG